jgi:hypothetical protein
MSNGDGPSKNVASLALTNPSFTPAGNIVPANFVVLIEDLVVIVVMTLLVVTYSAATAICGCVCVCVCVCVLVRA